MNVEIFEFEPSRWSYKIGGASSGETVPSREAALLAAEQVKDKQAQAPVPGDQR